jgi:hypothetical protein
MQKIEALIREFVLILQKIYEITKRLRHLYIGKYFPGFVVYRLCIKQQMSMPEKIMRGGKM